MGLNWTEGLARASEGLANMGLTAFRREMQEAEAARAENLERLRQANQLERDKLNHGQALELQDRADDRADRRQKASDDRAERAEAGRDRRYFGGLKAQEDRQDARLALAEEKFAREQNETRLGKVREDERNATSDMLKLQAEYAKAKSASEGIAVAGTPQQQAEARGELDRLSALMEEARVRQLQAREEIKQWNARVRPDVGRQMREDTAGAPPPRLPATDVGLIPVPRESRSRFSDSITGFGRDPNDPLIPRQ